MNNQKATAAFITKKQNIDKLLERLKDLSDDHFERHPDQINYGDVGELEHIESQLQAITDMAFSEGEYAPLAK